MGLADSVTMSCSGKVVIREQQRRFNSTGSSMDFTLVSDPQHNQSSSPK